MIIELSIKKNKSISLFDYIIFSSNYYKALSKKDIYECFIPASLNFYVLSNNFEIVRNDLIIVFSDKINKMVYLFDSCKFSKELLEEFGSILKKYDFKTFLLFDEQPEKIFSKFGKCKFNYIEINNFKTYIDICYKVNRIYPLFMLVNKKTKFVGKVK